MYSVGRGVWSAVYVTNSNCSALHAHAADRLLLHQITGGVGAAWSSNIIFDTGIGFIPY